MIHLLLNNEAPLRFMDSTMVPVCKRIRADSHKTARNIAAFGKNHQGWHYGFKLYASIDNDGRLSGVALTSANVYDAHAMGTLLNEYARIAVGDTSYGASVMRDIIWIAPPHPKQNRKVMTKRQHVLLTMRLKIESVFDYLKEHLHLVTSFPRSVNGYIFHYLRILLGYQMLTF